MNRTIFILSLLFTCHLGAQSIIKHTAVAANTQGHITTINSTHTDGKSNAILVVTQNYGAYNTNEIGVWYNNGKWRIFNQNLKKMPLNAKFNILVLPASSTNTFVYTTTTTNTTGHISTINSTLTNANPDALVFVTQRFGKYNASNVGVYYSGNRWRIFNEKTRKTMPIGTQFNVVVLKPGENRMGNASTYAFRYTNDSEGHMSIVKAPVPMARNATLFTTQRWKNVYNANVTGVWYNGSKWTVYNQNRKAMPKGIQHNVLTVNYSTQEIKEEIAGLTTAKVAVARSVQRLPKNVTRQNFSSKFKLTTKEKSWLNTHSQQRSALLNFYTANPTVNGERFTQLAVEALANDVYVNVEEAYIETPTTEEEVFEEAEEEEEVAEEPIEGFIPFPIVLSTADTVQIKFGTTSSDQQHANQIVSNVLIDGIKHAVELANGILLEDDKIKSIYIMATTNGKHGTNSNHYYGSAVDISRINDEKMVLSGVTYQIIQLQMAFDNYTFVRENFGPIFKHKYSIENDSWNLNHPVGGHQTHIHFSVRK